MSGLLLQLFVGAKGREVEQKKGKEMARVNKERSHRNTDSMYITSYTLSHKMSGVFSGEVVK